MKRERERVTNYRREGVVGAFADAIDSLVHHEDASKLGLLSGKWRFRAGETETTVS